MLLFRWQLCAIAGNPAARREILWELLCWEHRDLPPLRIDDSVSPWQVEALTNSPLPGVTRMVTSNGKEMCEQWALPSSAPSWLAVPDLCRKADSLSEELSSRC